MKINFILILVLSFLIISCQSKSEVIEQPPIGSAVEINSKILQFLANYPELVPKYYDDNDFEANNEPKIDSSLAIESSGYFKASNRRIGRSVIPRMKLALRYQTRGDIDKFHEILRDIIVRYPYNAYSGQSAYFLGEFENFIYNLELAQKYLTYVVNVHYHSLYGRKAKFLLAQVLEKRNYHRKSETLLLELMQSSIDSELFNEVYDFSRKKTISRILWFWQKKDTSQTLHYYSHLKKIDELKKNRSK